MIRNILMGILLLLVALAGWTAPVSSFTRTVTARGRAFTVKGVRVELTDPRVSVRLGLAWDHVARTESLASIAQRNGAVAAINGSFFDAYSKEAYRNPDMALMTSGYMVYKSELGSILGFEADNTPHIGRLRYRVLGTVTHEGRTEDWFAYWINRLPSGADCVTLFTTMWGREVTPMAGTLVVVENGTVRAITREATPIPATGFVLHLRGQEALLRRFHVGDTVVLAPEVTVTEGDAAAWGRVREAVGAGPRVLRAGEPVFAPADEGFADPKILERSGARSAAGYTTDGVLYLITTTNARVSDLGSILQALGCHEGMNLDGGASSGLWYAGAYLTRPGREISNALIVISKE